ncbi:MAG TPA: serine--tRNA ligase [Planctomycetota bacterium]|nr:serine--tRNA ligase [Planctomycetota bacterium]
MLDMTVIRGETDRVRKALADREARFDLDALLALDAKRRELITRTEALKAERNANSKQVSELKKKGADASAVIERTKAIGGEIKTVDEELRAVETDLAERMMQIPNLPAPDVPVGDASKNRLVRGWGRKREFDFTPKTHWEIGETLDVLDFPRATKIVEPHFALFKGAGARLVRALTGFMLDLHTTSHGYTEVLPPFLVNRKAMTGTGQLPKFEEDMYRMKDDDLFLIPTAEVPITNLFMDEILNEGDLPVRYTACTACFRREAGSYGKDTRALMRVHQFDKVEMVKFVKPETSAAELETLLANAEKVVQLLGIPYRVMLLSTLDMSFAASKCYDIEIWAPGIERWLETSSCSNFLDFQARRANIRFRDTDGKVKFVHTLNGSGVAFARLIAALLENYQQKDGSVTLPEVLRPYMGGMEKIEAK